MSLKSNYIRFRLNRKLPIQCNSCGKKPDRKIIKGVSGRLTKTSYPLTLDHVMERRNFGIDDVHNFQLLCNGCHDKKNKGIILGMIEEIKGMDKDDFIKMSRLEWSEKEVK